MTSTPTTAAEMARAARRRTVRSLLPAFLMLLVPLVALLVFGSLEFSRLHQRADTALRERTLSFLQGPAQQFDAQLGAFLAELLDPDLETAHSPLSAAAVAYRSRDAAVLDLLVLERSGKLVYPRLEGPPGRGGQPGPPPARQARLAQSLLMQGDTAGGIEQLRALQEDPRQENRTEIRGRAFALLQLGGALRKAGDLDQAERTFQQALNEIQPVERGPRRRVRQAAGELSTLTLLARQGCAELAADLHGDLAPLVKLLRELATHDFAEVAEGALLALIARAAPRLTGSAEGEDAVALARSSVMDLVVSRQRGHALERLAGHLLGRLATPEADGPLYQVYDPGPMAVLAAVRPVRPAERSLYPGDFVGFLLDLTALTARIADSWADPDAEGFHVEVLMPDGARVLRSRRPAGAEDWHPDLLQTTSAFASLRLQAIPRNVGEQLASRRVSVRNQALLLLALGLVAGGGALSLLRSTARATELARLKVDLVSRVSHELRTPLAMIKLYGDTLALGRTTSPDQAPKFAGIISREADRLTLMIDRILDFSRVQAGTVVYRAEPVDLGELVQAVTDNYRPHVEAAGARLAALVEPGLQACVDPSALQAAVVNLLENAVKYTPRDAADRTIEVVLRHDGRHAILEVLDRGLGVPPAELAKIFDDFYRASNAGEVRGAGLGLSLVRHFAKAHGGTIQASARQGGGSVFRLQLPLASVPATAQRKPIATETNES